MAWSWSSHKWSAGASDRWSSWNEWQGTHWSQGTTDWSNGGAGEWRCDVGNRRGRHGQSGTSENARMDDLSREMVKVLRHSGRRLGLEIRPDGFARVNDLVRLAPIRKFSPSDNMIRSMVRSNAKQRFSLYEDGDGLWLRANQGHSLAGIDMGLLCGYTLQELPAGEVCCHGTQEKYLHSILSRGLLAGGLWGQGYRRDVHFSTRKPGEHVVSGMRHNCEICVYVDLPRAARCGIKFYKSSNDVILSEGVDGVIPPEFFERVVHIRSGAQLWPEESNVAVNSHAELGQSRHAADSVWAADRSAAGWDLAIGQQQAYADDIAIAEQRPYRVDDGAYSSSSSVVWGWRPNRSQ